MEHVIPYCHRMLKAYAREDSICIDFTTGNGHDTLLLAQLCPKGMVWGFDIQPQAIENTKKLLDQHQISNVNLIMDNHRHLTQYLSGPFDLGVFNLGYLPKSNRQTITQTDSTLAALAAGLNQLRSGGLLVLVCYTGHPGGTEESASAEQYLSNLTDKNYICTKYHFVNKASAPYVLAVEKR